VHGLVVITDYFVICSGATERQVRTIVEEIERALRDLGRKPVRREGESERRWVLLDYVDLVVHVFTEQEREYYDLERLWGDAPRSAWEDEGVASSSG
jgi:ribosome-associated protein